MSIDHSPNGILEKWKLRDAGKVDLERNRLFAARQES